MIDRAGIFVDLKGLCPLSESVSRRVGESEGREELNPLVFSALELKQPILNGNLTQVKGVVTNRSSQPVPLLALGRALSPLRYEGMALS